MSEKENIPRDVTVKELINLLLDCPMDWKVVIRSKGGSELRGASISVKEPKTLGALFG